MDENTILNSIYNASYKHLCLSGYFKVDNVYRREEIMRGIHLYNFNHQDWQLSRIRICSKGASFNFTWNCLKDWLFCLKCKSLFFHFNGFFLGKRKGILSSQVSTDKLDPRQKLTYSFQLFGGQYWMFWTLNSLEW